MPDLPPPINHVFVDYENVHTIDLSVIGAKSVYFTLLLGARQNRLDVPLVEKLMAHAASVQLVRLTSSGKNALDFALTYYVGRAAVTDPTAYFHIISKDKGFDPLISHLRTRHLRATRHADFSTLTFSALPKIPVQAPTNAAAKSPKKAAKKMPTKKSASPNGDLQARVVAHLKKNNKNRPKRRKTLESHLVAFAGKNGSEAQVDKLIKSLCKAGRISFSEKGAVTYSL